MGGPNNSVYIYVHSPEWEHLCFIRDCKLKEIKDELESKGYKQIFYALKAIRDCIKIEGGERKGDELLIATPSSDTSNYVLDVVSSVRSSMSNYLKLDKSKTKGLLNSIKKCSDDNQIWEKVFLLVNNIASSTGIVKNFTQISPLDNNNKEIKVNDLLTKIQGLPEWINIEKPIEDLKYFKFEGLATWGTSWAFDALKKINDKIIERNGKEYPNIKKHGITINGISPQWGYRPLGITHKTGLDIDFRIITSDGKKGDCDVGGNYLREEQKFFLQCIKEANIKQRNLPLFGDEKLHKEDTKLFRRDKHRKHHNDHVHLELGKPG